MKNLKILIPFYILLISGFIQAQDLNQGTIKMEITDVNSDNPQIAAQMEMMKGAITEYSFNEDKSLVSADMMGGMIKMKSLVNNSDEHLTFLFDAMGQKMMVESTKEERAKFEDDQKEMMENVSIEYDEKDTKEILGYKCIKATVKGGEDFPMNFHMYVAKDIKASNKLIQGLQSFDIEGFPLEYVLDTEQMSMTYSATDLSDKVDAAKFEISTSGYQKMTFEEFQEQMGAFGGNMGF